MNITDPLGILKMELIQNLVPQVVQLLTDALAQGRPVHEVEDGLWDLALQVGRRGLSAFLDAHGTGDLGPTVTLPQGRQVHRLQETHARRYTVGTRKLTKITWGNQLTR
jgi:hypothetical protein